jgi:Zn-finger nucleic acid-binding protein
MSALSCPDCRLPLTTARFGPVCVHACRSCGGAWFPNNTLKAVAAAGDGVVRKLAEHLRAARNAVPPVPASHPACPECSQPLLSNPSATLTGVEVRACIPCKGHWAPMRALQVLSSQLTPRIRHHDSPGPLDSPSPTLGRKECLPSWKVTGPCPRCMGDRQIVECGDVQVEICSDCGGAWLEEAARSSLGTRSQSSRVKLLAEVRQIRSGKHRKPQRELVCPTCLVEMAPSTGSAPTCPKCAATFIDFYSLPDFLALTTNPKPFARSSVLIHP